MLTGIWLSDKTQQVWVCFLGPPASQQLLWWAEYNLELYDTDTETNHTKIKQQQQKKQLTTPATAKNIYKVCLGQRKSYPVSILSLTVVKIDA